MAIEERFADSAIIANKGKSITLRLQIASSRRGQVPLM
jgi:hypothetical protein